MAGSYNHIVTDTGSLRNHESFGDLIENGGDAYEMAEEMYGMIWYLASHLDGHVPALVEEARLNYSAGLEFAEKETE
jgi:hypothetical protein